MYVVLFISRNKDNKDIKGFRPRQKQFLVEDPYNCDAEFLQFVDMGVPGELCRYYISLSPRNVENTRKMLACRLIMDENINLANLKNLMVSIAMQPENELEKKWLFDFDCDLIQFAQAFLKDVWEEVGVGAENAYLHHTLNGFAIEVRHGFDCRALLEKWNKKLKEINPKYEVTLHRNAMLLIRTSIK